MKSGDGEGMKEESRMVPLNLATLGLFEVLYVLQYCCEALEQYNYAINQVQFRLEKLFIYFTDGYSTRTWKNKRSKVSAFC